MDTPFTRRPAADEYDEFYAGYVEAAGSGDVLTGLERQRTALVQGYRAMSSDQLAFRYEPGKWSPKQILGHLIDAERVFSYRALRFARADETELPGMDQNVFIDGADFDSLPLEDMLIEFDGLRRANVALYGTFTDDVLGRTGVASGCRFTVRSLVWITFGHCSHHVSVLADRYRLPDVFETG